MSLAAGIAVASAAALLSACATRPVSITSGAVIENVTVVNTRDGSLAPGMAIAVDRGRIVRIARAGSMRTSGSALSIDARGKYAVPGFLDMHNHQVENADRKPAPWPLFIANGVTGFREMGGSPELLERGRRLNREIAQGLVAPEALVLTGRLIALPGIATAAQGVAEVQRQKALGADFVKITSVNRETFFAIAGEAKKLGLPLVGHLSPVVGSAEASNAGMTALEHFGAGLISAALDCSTEEASLRKEVQARAVAQKPPPKPPTPEMIQRALVNPLVVLPPADAALARRVLETYSEDKCRELARTYARNGTWHVPTLIRLKTMQFGADPAFAADGNLRYTPPTMRKLWQDVADQYAKTVSPENKATFERFYDSQMRMVRLFRQEGVRMLAGPDGGQWGVPGYSLHREFDELARAGLSPLDILQMTTLNGAQFLGREATMGTVEEGKNADLVLLDANPVASAANLHAIWGVVLKGQYFSRTMLEKMKDDLAAAYK
jgi:hypothetical protein